MQRKIFGQEKSYIVQGNLRAEYDNKKPEIFLMRDFEKDDQRHTEQLRIQGNEFLNLYNLILGLAQLHPEWLQ